MDWKWFKRAQVPKRTPRVFTVSKHHRVWGNNISFDLKYGGDKWSVTGWMTPMPKKGDIVLSFGDGGAYAAYVFIAIEPAGHVSDMFFGHVQFDEAVTHRLGNRCNANKWTRLEQVPNTMMLEAQDA